LREVPVISSTTEEGSSSTSELDNRKHKKLLNKVKSIQDAYYNAKLNADGTVTH
jgi:hypothetical protein